MRLGLGLLTNSCSMEDGVAALKAGAAKLAADSTLLRGGRLEAQAPQRLQAADVDEAQLRLTAEGALVCPKCERPVGEADGSGLAAATSRLEPRGTKRVCDFHSMQHGGEARLCPRRPWSKFVAVVAVVNRGLCRVGGTLLHVVL